MIAWDYAYEGLRSLWAHCLSQDDDISEYGAAVELYWQEKLERLWKKPS
jgi:hypothetical protein